jgi:hypothetical protein
MPNQSSSMQPTVGSAQTSEPLGSLIPERVRVTIRDEVDDETAFSIACRLFVEDTTGPDFKESVSAARLERAIARATLNAWMRGQGSAEGVGAAYAVVGNRVALAKHDVSRAGE